MLALPGRDESASSTAKQLAAHQQQAISGTASDLLDLRQNIDDSSELEPTRKNRRITRACDECRGRKTKCDGGHPCIHCSSQDLECTYDEPSKRSARLTRKEIDELWSKLQRAQSLLKSLLPDIDVDSLTLNTDTLRKLRMPTAEVAPGAELKSVQHSNIDQDVPLETVLEVTGQLELDERGNWSYQGHGSSSAFIRRLGEQFGNVTDSSLGKNTVLRLRPISQLHESVGNSEEQPFESSIRDPIPLPPRDIALDLVSSALNEACAILNFIHQPTFYSMLDRLYLTDPEKYGYEENKFLPLLYAVFAVGYLFSNSERVYFGYAHAVSEGEKYFLASRRMLSITECRDLWSLQAIVFMTIFLHSSAKISTCHSYVSAAMAASLQMGLHRCKPEALNPIERETRKRVFWAIRTIETYIAAILGLPRTVGDDDIDQEMPLEVDDQYIIKEGILPMPDGQISMLTGFNAHIKLIQILGKVTTDVYPTKQMQKEAPGKPRAYVVNDAKVREVENNLQQWVKSLPMQLRPGADSPTPLLRMQHILRLAFTHVQIVLYRPFLHYISGSKPDTPTNSQCYAYAAACVDVSRNVIHNERQMEKQDILSGPYWFSIYTTFCATLSLVFYVWENVEVEGALQILKDAEHGRDVLAKLAYKSVAAGRHSDILATIFTRLPERLSKGLGTKSRNQKKRNKSPPKKNESRESYDDQDGVGHNSYKYVPPSSAFVDSQSSTRTTESADFGNSPSLNTPPNPQPFTNIPKTSTYGDFTRFLGPDSIEDLFGQQHRNISSAVSPNLGSMALDPFQNVVSLDQYVSTLDLQNELAYLQNTNNSTSGVSSLHCGGLGDATIDHAGQPFIPLSPYIMQMNPPGGSFLVSPESYFTDEYYMVDKNAAP